MKLKPIIKCPGGKTKLLDTLLSMIPEHTRYVEPFIGGGALFFALQPEEALIADVSQQLINVYEQIKHNVESLIILLRNHRESHSKEHYYTVRKEDKSPMFQRLPYGVDKAARYIYLNKTCFNGLIRVNKSNQFNVPMGAYTHPRILDKEMLLAISEYLNNNNIKIKATGFTNIFNNLGKGDFCYLDPPYHSISETSNFTAYTVKGFTLTDHIRLKLECDKLTKKNVKWVLSNSYCKTTLDLWKDYEIIEVFEKRNIAANVKSRKNIKEILVKNF